MSDFNFKVDLEVVYCPRCAIPFGVLSELRAMRHRDGAVFFCPNGHEQHFPDGKNLETWRAEALDLKEQLKASEQKRCQLIHQLDQMAHSTPDEPDSEEH